MNRLLIAALLATPLAVSYGADRGCLKSAVTVERGVYKNNWERDFFRDILVAEGREEVTDGDLFPDGSSPVADADHPARRDAAPVTGRIGGPAHRAEPSVEPVEVVKPEASMGSPDEEGTLPDEGVVPQPPVAKIPASPLPEEEESLIPDDDPPEEQEALPPPHPGVDPEKKREERRRELERKRKKGNFRDPKIAY